jgi:hypothetical protein
MFPGQVGLQNRERGWQPMLQFAEEKQYLGEAVRVDSIAVDI